MIRKMHLVGQGLSVVPQQSISILTDSFLAGFKAAVNTNYISQLPLLLNAVPSLSSGLLDVSHGASGNLPEESSAAFCSVSSILWLELRC